MNTTLLAPNPARTVRLGEELTIKVMPDGGVVLKQDDDMVYILPEDVHRVVRVLREE